MARMVKRHYKLTKEQRERGVVFSSEIVGLERHEVFVGTKNVKSVDDAISHYCKDWDEAREIIDRLKDVRFFSGNFDVCVERS